MVKKILYFLIAFAFLLASGYDVFISKDISSFFAMLFFAFASVAVFSNRLVYATIVMFFTWHVVNIVNYYDTHFYYSLFCLILSVFSFYLIIKRKD